MGSNMVPLLGANLTGRSLASYFPNMKPMLLVIAKHKFNLGQLFKINPQLKDKPRDGHLQLSEAGVLIKAERDASPKNTLPFNPSTTPFTYTSMY